jgi:alpha-galactosidase/6-phospho-beta-glucosidase family protein
LVGAGSVVCTRGLLGDIRSSPELAQADVRLMGADDERLRVAELALDEIGSLVDELLEAHADLLPTPV